MLALIKSSSGQSAHPSPFPSHLELADTGRAADEDELAGPEAPRELPVQDASRRYWPARVAWAEIEYGDGPESRARDRRRPALVGMATIGSPAAANVPSVDTFSLWAICPA
ncbi:MAG: hypothetical protein ACRDYX_12115 [Egibacteraceae bacterium]